MWSALNHDNLPVDDPDYSDARRHILARLGDYAALIIEPHRLRPTGASLICNTPQRIEVRISTASAHVVLVINPNEDLAGEICFLRQLADKHLTIPRLIHYDLSTTVTPFTYALVNYMSGIPLSSLDPQDPQIRIAARQVGRTLRRIHQTNAPGYGRPQVNGRWPHQSWRAALGHWLTVHDTRTRAQELFPENLLQAFWQATYEHPSLQIHSPKMIHGAIDPDHVLVAVGENIHVEGITQPSNLIGGDPLFDLAYATLPKHPALFSQGLLEGYNVAGLLDEQQLERMRRLQLLIEVVDTLWQADPIRCEALPEHVATVLQSLR
jgi:aminoglycoside phosphotransferase (APT) family kinase protein